MAAGSRDKSLMGEGQARISWQGHELCSKVQDGGVETGEISAVRGAEVLSAGAGKTIQGSLRADVQGLPLM